MNTDDDVDMRIVQLEQRMQLATRHLIDEVSELAAACAEHERRLNVANVRIERLLKQRGLYWRLGSRVKLWLADRRTTS